MLTLAQTDFVAQHADLSTTIFLLDKWIHLQTHERHLPGLAIGVIQNGELIWGKGYGFANLEDATPVTVDTRFRIASITKTFTAVAIMQLRDSGRLRLDDPVSQDLNWFDLRYDGAPPITIRHLLTHTSGLPRDATVPHWTENVFQAWDEVVATTRQRKPISAPLQDFGYSNLGYTLLGGVIEAVSGKTWRDYIQTHILNPLEMNNTLIAPTSSDTNLAVGYFIPDDQHARKSVPFIATNGFSPAGSMASSINDLAKYARFHLSTQDTPVLSSYSLREMHNIQWLNKDWQAGYGLGIGIQHLGEWTVSGHAGGYKGYLTFFVMCREHNFGVIVLTNSLDSDPFQFVDRAYRMVLPEILKITKAETPEPGPEWQKFVGTYYDDAGELEVIVREGQLQIVSLRNLNVPPAILEPTDDTNEFIIKEPGGPWETARFERDTGGNVTRLWLRHEYVLPKPSKE